jgi:hypothetical protein
MIRRKNHRYEGNGRRDERSHHLIGLRVIISSKEESSIKKENEKKKVGSHHRIGLRVIISSKEESSITKEKEKRMNEVII